MRNLIILLLLPFYVLAIDKKNSNSLSPQTLIVECPVNITISEGQKYDTSVTGFPKIVSNDGGDANTSYIELFNAGNCSNGNDLVTRIFTTRNAAGSSERCTQTIFIKHLRGDQIRFPTDTTIEYPKDKSLADAILGRSQTFSTIEITYIDTKISNLCNIPVRLRRDWSIKDACTNTIIKKSTIITLIAYQNSFEQNKSIVNDVCNDEGQISLSAKGEFGPYSYLWNNGSKANFITNLKAGNYSVVISDKFNCTLLNSFTISSISESGDLGGLISTESNYRVYPDSIYLDDPDNIAKFCSSENGGIQYAFKLKKKNTGFISYRFVKRSQILDGVSTKDIVIIQRHILGKQLLPDTLRYFAADVNKNFTVSSSDISELRKVILGVKLEFTNVLPWYFFRPDWKTTISKNNAYESIYFKGINVTTYPRLNADVLAVKMGDVDLSFSGLTGELDKRDKILNDKVFLKTSRIVSRDYIDFPVYLNQSGINLEGLQCAIKLNGSAFSQVIPGQLDQESYFLHEQLLKLSYSTGEILSLDNSKPLFTIRLKRDQLGDNISNYSLAIDPSLKAEFYTSNLLENELTLKIEENAPIGEFEIYPNPSKDFFFLNKANANPKSELKIYDLTGKLLFNKPINEVNSIAISDWSIGSYYFILELDQKIISSGSVSVTR